MIHWQFPCTPYSRTNEYGVSFLFGILLQSRYFRPSIHPSALRLQTFFKMKQFSISCIAATALLLAAACQKQSLETGNGLSAPPL